MTIELFGTRRVRAAVFATLFVGVGVAVSAQGCSSKTPDGPPGTDKFAGVMADNFCSALHSCCDAAKLQYDNGSCSAQLQAQFQVFVDIVKHGKVVYDPNAVAACEAAIKDRESKCTPDGGAPPTAAQNFLDPITTACWPVLKGIVKLGDECNDSGECATASASEGGSCRTDNRPGADPAKKVCFKTVGHVLAGQPCRSTPKMGEFVTEYCEPTIGFCDTSGAQPGDLSAGTCKAYAQAGDDCSSVGTNRVACEPTSTYCDFMTTKCVALPQAGSPCANGGFQGCASGNYCDRTGGTGVGTCASLKGEGVDCKSSNECASQFCNIIVQPPSDGGLPPPNMGVCQGNGSRSSYQVSPRTCGFGPSGSGPDDAGIAPPAKTQGLREGEGVRGEDTPWYAQWL